MTDTTLVDLAPALQVMLAGALLASLALGWLWLRNRRQSARPWQLAATLLTLFLTFDLVVFGAFTRLTDSGLGCPDWPGCYGSASPVGAKAEIAAAQAAMPTGPVTQGKAWIEMLHRYMATGVGALIMVLAFVAWRDWLRSRDRQTHRGPAPWLATLTLVWVCVQGAFGALTVTMKLFPAIVTLHLLGGLLLLVMLTAQAVRQVTGTGGGGALAPDVGAGTRSLLWAGCVVLLVQLALGGWVSTNYAVLACTDFPTCQGRWWPEMRFDEGFEVWRELGKTADGDHISFAALTAIHYTHRLMAVVVVLVLGWLAWRLAGTPGLRLQGRAVAGLVLLQVLTGLGNVVLGWPLVAALLHTAGAAALVVVLSWTVALVSRAAPLAASAPQGARPAGRRAEVLQ